ncbi:MAG: hypothetical protein KGZ85_00730 [Ignavibacterium sp.]|nr:hypothetical protein [Ignavibacterium sp.]
MKKLLWLFIVIAINTILAQHKPDNNTLHYPYINNYEEIKGIFLVENDKYISNMATYEDFVIDQTITKYWFNAGIGKSYFGPTIKLGISYEYNQNIFSFRYLKADEFQFSTGGYHFEEPPLKFYEIAMLYCYPYRIHNMTIGFLAGIGYINGIERGMLIQHKLYESIKIEQLSIPIETYFKIEPFKFVSLGIAGFGNINAKRSFFGAMIDLSIGNF